MSGGAYDYAYMDAEQVQAVLREMQSDAESDEDVPLEILDAFQGATEAIEDVTELMQLFEWYKSGDVSVEQLNEGTTVL